MTRIMRKYFFLTLFLVFLSGSLNAQEIICENLQKNGEMIMQNGKPFTGKCFSYYNNGNKKYSCAYFQGLKEGREETFYESGPIKTKANYCEGKMHGDCTYSFYLEDGQEKSTISFENGKKTDIIQFTPYYLYPVIVGEENGTIKRSLLKGKDQIEVKVIKTYNKYFNDKGVYDPKYTYKITPDYPFILKGDINFVRFKMYCELPIWPPRESIYDHIKFNGKAEGSFMSDSMRECFLNGGLGKFSITDLVFYRRDGLKNYMWTTFGREFIIVE